MQILMASTYPVEVVQAERWIRSQSDDHMTDGFALLAWPVEHGSSGVMTFVVNQQGVVFEKDLGKRTAEIAPATNRYDPDESWMAVGAWPDE